MKASTAYMLEKKEGVYPKTNMNTEQARKAVENFMYYMYNQWDEDESRKVFGKIMGDHLWAKWCTSSDELRWFAYLDDANRTKIIERANEVYNK